jgi:hypothetical protein
MSRVPHIALEIGELGINGLDRMDAQRLAAAFERALQGQIGEMDPSTIGASVALDRLQLTLPSRGSPEAMGAGIASQLTRALTANSASATRLGGTKS